MPSTTPSLTERQFQAQVIDLAKRCGWMVFHPQTATRNGAWATFQAGHPGFPDLVLAHQHRGVLFVELKRDRTRNRLSEDQVKWSTTLQAAGARWHLWSPSDWDTITETLSKDPRHDRTDPV